MATRALGYLRTLGHSDASLIIVGKDTHHTREFQPWSAT